jgi:hypothetical protein
MAAAAAAVAALSPVAARARALFAAQGPDTAVGLLFDDAYYYLTIAANLAETGRSTFDGIELTNGYQPLWLAILAALARLVGTPPFRLFFATCLLVYLLVASAVVAAVVQGWRGARDAMALAVAVPLGILYGDRLIFLGGLETVLFAPLAVALLRAIERAGDDPASLRRLGGWLALAVLVRLDAFALVTSTLFVTWLGSRRGGGRTISLRQLAWGFGPAVATLAVYFAVNAVVFGTALPVSGLAKALGNRLFHNVGIIGDFVEPLGRMAPLLVLWGGLEAAAKTWAPAPPTFRRAIAALLLAWAIQLLYYTALSAWPLWPWYRYTLALATMAIVARIALLALALLEARHPLAPVLAAGTLTLVAIAPTQESFQLSALVLPSTRLDPIADAAPGPAIDRRPITFNQVSLIMLRTMWPSPGRAVVAMGDRAGGLSFWGRQTLSVVQTEGLVSGIGYLQARRAGRGADYLAALAPIAYLIVDRQTIPTTNDGSGRKIYVVADPIQARTSMERVPIFCFPETAIAFRLVYGESPAEYQRVAFAFPRRVPCGADELQLIEAATREPGLRQLSLPAEYLASPLQKRLEDFGRRGLPHAPAQGPPR